MSIVLCYVVILMTKFKDLIRPSEKYVNDIVSQTNEDRIKSLEQKVKWILNTLMSKIHPDKIDAQLNFIEISKKDDFRKTCFNLCVLINKEKQQLARQINQLQKELGLLNNDQSNQNKENYLSLYSTVVRRQEELIISLQDTQNTNLDNTLSIISKLFGQRNTNLSRDFDKNNEGENIRPVYNHNPLEIEMIASYKKSLIILLKKIDKHLDIEKNHDIFWLIDILQNIIPEVLNEQSFAYFRLSLGKIVDELNFSNGQSILNLNIVTPVEFQVQDKIRIHKHLPGLLNRIGHILYSIPLQSTNQLDDYSQMKLKQMSKSYVQLHNYKID